MNENLEYIKQLFQDNPDLIFKEIKINNLHSVYVIFLETLCSQDKINDYILKTLTKKKFIQDLNSNIPGGNSKNVKTKEECENYLYNGYTIILSGKQILAVETKADLSRSISTNEIEPSLKGPKNSFIENYQTNLGLIKRRIRSAKLKTKTCTIGRISKTMVGVLYIDDIAKTDLVNDVYNKLKNIDIDLINGVENLIGYLSNNSLFPTIITTERPDRCAEALSEGKIVIICDESPYALIMPAFLVDFINPFADKYNKRVNSNFTKILRISCFILSAIVPAFYIAIINYNPEAIPTSLIINFAMQRDGVPFPAFIECLMLLLLCEILRESDLRFPTKYGSAISILGSLVLGDAAVTAGLVSPIMIIIATFTYISSLLFPEHEISNALRIYRLLFLLFSFLLGLYGLFLIIIYFILKLCEANSFKYPYTFPVAPFDKAYFKEFVIRLKNKKRSAALTNNITKES